MQRGYPAIAGRGTRPARQTPVNAGSDCWIEMTFIDRNGAAFTPTTLTYRIDDLTNGQSVVGTTSLSPSGSTYELDIAGSVNQLNNGCSTSSQTNQVYVVAVDASGYTYTQTVYYELIGISLP